VTAAVRNVPAIIGHKLVQRYFRGERYMETDVDVSSSLIASGIVSLCRGYARYIHCECGVVLQGEADDELPESMLACVELKYLDFEPKHLERLLL
jgi:hypothetical protein